MELELVKAIEALGDTLKCKVCSTLFEDPVVIGSCGHTFCKKCLLDCQTCPSCEIPVDDLDSHDDKQLKDILPLFQRLKHLVKENLINSCDAETSKENKEMNVQGTRDDPVSLPTRLTRTPKPGKRSLCCGGGSTPGHEHVTDKEMRTPKNGILKKRSLSTPSFKSTKRSPCRFAGFSSKKLLSKAKDCKLVSPINIEKKNIKGETLLQMAVIKGDLQRVRELLRMNADPNVKDNAGWTPLHEASNHGFLEITQLLVEHGAVLDVVGQDDITPLHDSIMNGHMDVAFYLASKGANIHAKTSLGNTALDLCEGGSNKKSLLKSFNCFTDASAKKEVSVNENVKLICLCTGLDDSQKEKFKECIELLEADSVEDFNTDVTHVITCVDESGQCTRTLKILQGILNAAWIVNMQWIETCLEYKKRVSEEAFEIPGTKQMPNTFGPKLARENAAKEFPPLFDGCSFYIYGQINPPVPPKEDISKLVQLGGGRLLSREPRPETADMEHSTPFHARNTSLSDVSYFILYQEKPPRNAQIRANHIYTVTVRWFIECICAFKLLDPDEQ